MGVKYSTINPPGMLLGKRFYAAIMEKFVRRYLILYGKYKVDQFEEE